MPHKILPSAVIGSLTSFAYILGEITENTHVPIGNALAGLVFVSGLVWYVARKIQSVEDGQEASKKAVAELTTNQITLIQNQRTVMEELKDLRHELASKPCQVGGCEGIAR